MDACAVPRNDGVRDNGGAGEGPGRKAAGVPVHEEYLESRAVDEVAADVGEQDSSEKRWNAVERHHVTLEEGLRT